MLTRDGVKVLNFGLAKAVAPKPGPTEETLTNVLTTEGTVMGTPQSMAPEQFGGKEADSRSDIWAFGAVLYDMVTGQKAFQGSNYQRLVGAILAMDPPPMSIARLTPSRMQRLVRRCLAKDPDDRVTLCDAPRGLGGSWGDDGNIIAAPGSQAVLFTATPLAQVNIGSGFGGNILALSPDGASGFLLARSRRQGAPPLSPAASSSVCAARRDRKPPWAILFSSRVPLHQSGRARVPRDPLGRIGQGEAPHGGQRDKISLLLFLARKAAGA